MDSLMKVQKIFGLEWSLLSILIVPNSQLHYLI